MRLRSTRLELRLPADHELCELAQVAEAGVHPPGEMPFRVPWTDAVGSPTFVADFLAHHREVRARWSPAEWTLNLGVWASGEPIGSQSMRAKAFPSERTIETGSWLGARHQRKGYGTEMRAAVLELAFAGLGARAALSGYFDGNVASARVAEKLGYVPFGEATVAPRGEPVRELIVRLDRERWLARPRVDVEIEGLEPCLPLFGITR